MKTATLASVFLLLMGACGDDDVADGGVDAGRSDVPVVDAPESDAGGEDGGPETDAGSDAGSDAMEPTDVGVDVPPMDAGPPVNPLDGMGAVEVAADAFEGEAFGFTEGPHWLDGRLYFTDQYFGRPDLTAVYALTPPSDLVRVVNPSDGANGLASDPEGNLISCLQAGRRVARIEQDNIVTLFDRYEGDRFNATNDLIFRRDGGWFFTDPGYSAEADAEMDVRGVYFVAPGGEPRRVWSGSLMQRPNGIVLSPDDSTLYLADTEDNVVRAFDVDAAGDLSGERTFVDVTGPDGMTVDVHGNVYVATRTGIEVFAPDGTRWGVIEMAMFTTNATFGDADRQTLYITTRTVVFRVRLQVQGIEGR